jgi:uncharacterized membrane protein YbaN (DUF454 family)
MFSKIKKNLYIFIGTFFLIVGGVGIVVPILPTTPFLILTSLCYMKGSKRLYNWIIHNRIFGNFIKNYYEGNGVSLQAKLVSISFLWLTISISIFFIVEIVWIEIILVVIAIAVTSHIVLLKRRKNNEIISGIHDTQ